jgi:hypothetical protein
VTSGGIKSGFVFSAFAAGSPPAIKLANNATASNLALSILFILPQFFI